MIIMAITLLAWSSCQKVIDLKTASAAPQIVIEGNLTDEYGDQEVVISRSVPFTSTNTFPPVTGATVFFTDSTGHTYPLPEVAPGTYRITPFFGKHGQTYSLTVTSGGITYTATSTMPQLVKLDSVTAKINSFGKSDLRTIVVNYQDPINEVNQYRYVLFINGHEAGTIFADDDNFTNGRYVKRDLFQNGTDIHHNDTATVEMQCIDKNMFKYWFSLEQQQGNGPGGGTAPSNPPSNFNNNALGYFSAHTTQVKSIVVN